MEEDSVMPEYSVQDLKDLLNRAIDKFLEVDRELLDIGISERCVAHRLALHLQAFFPELHVDCEYNRRGLGVKALKPPKVALQWDDEEAKTVFPDIVVHKRMTPKHNTLVIEMKKTATGALADFDRDKLAAFTRRPFSYTLGAFLTFKVGGDAKFDIEWFPIPAPARKSPFQMSSSKQTT